MKLQSRIVKAIMRIWAFMLGVLLLGFPCFLYADYSTEKNTVVNVGLISELGSWEGKLVQSFVSMAVQDFYNLNKGFRTRIALHVRDSKGDSLHSISAALDLLENVDDVQAIIIPKISNEELFLARLGDEVHVPILSFSSLSSSSHHPYFIQVAEDEINQFHGIAALIKAFEWRSFVFLYEDTDDTRLSQAYINDIFQEKHLDVTYRILHQASNDQIIDKLQKLNRTKTFVFVVHLSPSLVSQVFINAEKLGMMRAGFAWIVTSKVMDFLDPQDSSLSESMIGVLGFKSYFHTSIRLQNLTMRSRREFESKELNIVALWEYDAAWVLAQSIEKADDQTSQNHSKVLDSKSLDLSRLKVSNNGPSILSKISSSRFTGLVGEFQLKDRKLVRGMYQIRNIICKVERQVGFWTPAYGLTKDSPNNSLSAGLDTIIWPGFSFTTPQSQPIETGKILRVGLPGHVRFPEFVGYNLDSTSNKTTYSGYCLDVFHAALDRLPTKMLPKFITFVNENVTYSELMHQVYLKNIDVAVGDITILSNRSAYVDFTLPYSEGGVGVMVKLENDPWFFLKPLSPELWIASAGSFIVMGFIVWLIEHRVNEEFQGPPAQRIGAMLWFAVSTLVYAHRERLQSNASRFVVGVWLFVVLILTSSYIATLTSQMTVAEFKLAKAHSIGYSANSFVRGMIVADNLNFGDSRLKPYRSPEHYYGALMKGSKNGGIDAILEEVPYIKALVARHPNDYTMVKFSPITVGFGFAFPKGSPMVHEMSKAIAELREEGKLLEMEKMWFKNHSLLSNQDTDLPKPNTLTIHQFTGLFLINGISELIVITVFFAFLLREKLSSFCFHTMLSSAKFVCDLKHLYPKMDNRNHECDT